MSSDPNVSVQCVDLVFKYVEEYAGIDISGGPVLKGINCQLHRGQRVLLIGGNGAGKSTLLKMFGGKHLPTSGMCYQMGLRDSFRDTKLNLERTMVTSDWANRSVAFAAGATYCTDIAVEDMMVKLQQSFPERRAILMHTLRIDPAWRMHKLSMGQRCRVQLFLSLLRPSKIIILDEVLGCLDIVSRSNILSFLKQESEGPFKATVVLASHVFDGMEEWASHLMYLRSGQISFFGPLNTVPLMGKKQLSLYHSTEMWLREEEDIAEKECNATDGVLDNAQNRAGGYANGRLGEYFSLNGEKMG
ncbi:ATP-binding Cassette (ABC) Superfamily [Thraustotheca clavata]|uniref:ATP-binding Cassette (ABC) Superfamily n=1 Tax=Thraustotheca clavata TaxID=74557 RepID=A0A1W0A119_9STRA|nr:ATP-binding Cassette (ABC) Superfamily [Thraustotheca clavata]